MLEAKTAVLVAVCWLFVGCLSWSYFSQITEEFLVAKNTVLGDIYYEYVGDLYTINKLFINNLSLLYFLIRGFLIK